MKFRKQVKLKCALNAACALLGLVMLFVGILNSNGQTGIELFFASGAALLALGVLNTIRYVAALKNKNKFEELKIQQTDERMLHLNYKTGYATFLVSIVGLYVYSMYLLISGSPLFETFSHLCSIPLCIYLVCHVIVKKFN